MPEVNQIFFQHKEVAEVLLKKANIHEGKWMLSVNFGFAVGNFGAIPDQATPGAVATVLAIGIIRAAQDTPEALQVDASVVNPPSNASMRSRSAPTKGSRGPRS
jgi:hypothetical protein